MSTSSDYWVDFWRLHGRESRDGGVHEQVLRVKNKQAIDESLWQKTLEAIGQLLEVNATDKVLDLCCGNGLIARHLASQVASVHAVDVSEALVNNIAKQENISAEVCDARKLECANDAFSKIVLYAAIQYFTQQEVIGLFRSMYAWLEEGGVALLGDIPDLERLWAFYDDETREAAYFDAVESGKGIVGNWFTQSFLVKLAKYIGFSEARVVPQSDDMIYAHYRFDLILKK
jgi:cyclopropane fatty-acyl-phospholipid synthase-like methyltransferase